MTDMTSGGSIATDDAQITPVLSHWQRLMGGTAGPVTVMVLGLFVIWYIAVIFLNTPWQIDKFKRAHKQWTTLELVLGTMQQRRPVIPAPHQVLVELNKTVLQKNVTSRRSLIYHSAVTLSSTLLGFLTGGLLGILLAVGIVHKKSLDKSLMPWIIASQTVPILAIAPMVIVVLGAIGLKGLIPKSIISMYLCFFPVAISMVKGLRSPDSLQLDLMRTFSASKSQVFFKLRWQSSLPYLFTSLKVSVAISLVGAIVAELPTGAQAGLGSRLLAGSYYGQTVQIWAALVAASVLAASLVTLIGVIERLVFKRMGVH